MTNTFHENQRCLVSLLRSAHGSVSVCAIKIIDYYYIVHYFIMVHIVGSRKRKRAEISRAGRMDSFIVFVNMNKYFEKWFNNKKLTPIPSVVLQGGLWTGGPILNF